MLNILRRYKQSISVLIDWLAPIQQIFDRLPLSRLEPEIEGQGPNSITMTTKQGELTLEWYIVLEGLDSVDNTFVNVRLWFSPVEKKDQVIRIDLSQSLGRGTWSCLIVHPDHVNPLTDESRVASAQLVDWIDPIDYLDEFSAHKSLTREQALDLITRMVDLMRTNTDPVLLTEQSFRELKQGDVIKDSRGLIWDIQSDCDTSDLHPTVRARMEQTGVTVITWLTVGQSISGVFTAGKFLIEELTAEPVYITKGGPVNE